jgi:hypothetical protein
LTTTGRVKCWGDNEYGELGNGTTTNSDVPVDVAGLVGIKAITTGYNTSCALTAAGGVKCWGYGEEGQLGNGLNLDSSVPVDVAGIQSGAVAISGGSSAVCALMETGDVKCWGGMGGFFTTSGLPFAVPMASVAPARLNVGECQVPGVVGRPLFRAGNAVRDAGCRTGSIRRRQVPAARRGRVLGQHPRAGTRVPLGTRVNLVVGAAR